MPDQDQRYYGEQVSDYYVVYDELVDSAWIQSDYYVEIE